MPRIKKLTDYSYSPTNPASEDAIRAQIDDAIQEVYDASAKNTDTANLTGAQTIGGVKMFTDGIKVPVASAVDNPIRKDTFETHKTSADHDGRYYTEAEVNALLLANQQGNHLGLWQGLTPTYADPGIAGVVAQHSAQLEENSKDIINDRDMIIFDFDFKNIKCENALSPLNIPTYVPLNNEIVHPSVLFFKSRWNGYHYWMAFTPYTQTNSDYENPSIVVSNDGINWIEPVGIVNPIVQKPIGGYNADVNLFEDKYGEKIHCVYRERISGVSRVKIVSSSDGINWTSPTEILYTAGKDNASPCVFWDDNKYVMLTANLDSHPTTTLQMYTSESALSGWQHIKDISIPNIPSGSELWHFELRKYLGIYILVYTIASEGNFGSGGYLYMAKSKDLETWDTTEFPLLRSGTWDTYFYKSTFAVSENSYGKYISLWYGAFDVSNTWNVGYTEINIVPNLITQEKNNKLKLVSDILTTSKVNNSYSYNVFADDFNRANNTTAIGTSPTGQIWSSGLGIIGSSVYNSNDGVNTKSFVDILQKDFEASVIFEVVYKDMWFLFRGVGTITYYRFGIASNNVLTLEKITAGVATLISSWNTVHLKDGDIISVKCYQNTVSILINDELFYTFADNDYYTYTKIGLQTSNNVSRFKYMLAKTTIQYDLKANAKLNNENAVVKAINKIYGYVFGDNFSRADSLTSLGTSATGQTWTTSAGTFGLIGGLAYIPTDGVNSRVHVEIGISDFVLSSEFKTISDSMWLIFRYQDSSNYLRIGINTSNTRLQKIVAGSVTELFTFNSIFDKDILSVKCESNSIKIYVNDIFVSDVSCSDFASATKVGMQTSLALSRYSNINVKKIF